jgi:membrane protein
MIARIIKFFSLDIWRLRLADYSGARAYFLKLAMVSAASLKGFERHKCQLRASALTYYSLLSIVPVIAMAFGVAKGFAFEKLLEKQLLERFPAQQDILQQIFGFANTLLENTKGGLIAGIGVAVLFWTVIKVLGNIEESFNDIWGIQRQRPLARKFSDYLSMMLICPILLVVSSGITVFMSAQIPLIASRIALLGSIAPLVSVLIKAIPYIVIWVLFTFIYILMPNTKVRVASGIFAGIIAGSIYQAVQLVYVKFQVGVASYNAIYGSFAAIPLLLVWLQLSWLIVLFGAELSFVFQNVEMFEFEPDCARVSYAFRKLLSLRVVNFIAKHFSRGEKPASMTEISHTLNIPVRLLQQILFELVQAGILAETVTKDYKVPGYQPGIDPDTLTVHYVINALERVGLDAIPVEQSAELKTLSQSLKAFEHAVTQSPDNKLLKEI